MNFRTYLLQDPLVYAEKVLMYLWNESGTTFFADDAESVNRVARAVPAALEAIAAAKELIAKLPSLRMPDDTFGLYLPAEPTSVTLDKLLDEYREFSREFNRKLNEADADVHE